MSADREEPADADEQSGTRRLQLNQQLSQAQIQASHPVQKLTPETVIEIRERYDDGEMNRSALAREYGVAQPTIGDVVEGRSWQHVGGPTASDRQESASGGWADE